MQSRSRLFDRTLPLAVGGAIDFGNAFQLVAKSRRSALVLVVVWWPAKLLGAVQGECVAIEKLLKRWGAFKPNEKLTGSLIYKPLDSRGRSYMIGIGETRSYFAKVGPDVGIEALAKKVELQLKAAGFLPQLPISRHRYHERWVNLYNYFHSTEMTKVRLNLAQTSAFIEAMNTGNSTSRCVTLQSFFSNDKKQKAEYAAQILKSEKLDRIFEIISNHKIELGRIHADLMSPNLLRATNGTGSIAVLDWESYEDTGPLVIDKIGGLAWQQVVDMAQAAYKAPGTRRNNTDALAFMFITAARGFKPALDWLYKLRKT